MEVQVWDNMLAFKIKDLILMRIKIRKLLEGEAVHIFIGVHVESLLMSVVHGL